MRVLESLLLVACSAQSLFGERPSFEEALRFMDSIVDDVSISLTDDNFEHETQAATGATTGDWFVYFFSPHCTKCKFISPEWKFFAERMKEQQLPVNIARVNVDKNEKLVRRFSVTSYPTYLYFKGGFVYNYTGPAEESALDAVVKQENYAKYDKKPVPPEMTMLREVYLYLKWQAKRLWPYSAIGAVAACWLLLCTLLSLCKKSPSKTAKVPKRKKD